MSKFIDKLERIYRTATPPLGFRKSSEETNLSPLAIIADLSKASGKKVKSIADNKLDAAIVNSENIDADSFKELNKGSSPLPLGLLLAENSTPEKIQGLIGLDWDFLIFGLQTPLDMLSKEKTGKILKIASSFTPILVRAINELSFPIDAVLIADNNSRVTVEQLITCQLFAGLLNKPLLQNVDSSISNSELSNLHGAGVKGIILPEGTSLKAFAELIKSIGSLPKVSKRKTGTGALLPRLSVQTETNAEKVEDDDDDDEDI
jgi:hypothetical protein